MAGESDSVGASLASTPILTGSACGCGLMSTLAGSGVTGVGELESFPITGSAGLSSTGWLTLILTGSGSGWLAGV